MCYRLTVETNYLAKNILYENIGIFSDKYYENLFRSRIKLLDLTLLTRLPQKKSKKYYLMIYIY